MVMRKVDSPTLELRAEKVGESRGEDDGLKTRPRGQGWMVPSVRGDNWSLRDRLNGKRWRFSCECLQLGLVLPHVLIAWNENEPLAERCESCNLGGSIGRYSWEGIVEGYRGKGTYGREYMGGYRVSIFE
ncbi:hypothetical protein Goari_009565, partial [Gossypium aridum]|nr:hypothetical protein [Gossypium aridum]